MADVCGLDAPPDKDWISDRGFGILVIGAFLVWAAILGGVLWWVFG